MQDLIYKTNFDAVVIGGGGYGTMIAIHLAKQHKLQRILLVERESALLTRASYSNQARVHNGYHYPRSFTTAHRSSVNAPRFMQEWREAIQDNFTHLYAIARSNSKITSRQFVRFCREIGAKIQPANPGWQALFEPRLIEDVFLVEECAFDSKKLADLIEAKLKQAGVRICLETHVTHIAKGPNKTSHVFLRSKSGREEILVSRYLFNCTYSALNQFEYVFSSGLELKQEIAEMALLQMPPQLEGLGITVIDGPFFSILPFPARGLHTLSHVRYTPHMHWKDRPGMDPYQKLRDYDCRTRADRMIRDVGRYFPSIFQAKYVDSLFEVKTLLMKNEQDDGRPILFEKHK